MRPCYETFSRQNDWQMKRAFRSATVRERQQNGMHRYNEFGTLVSELENYVWPSQRGLRGIRAGKNEGNPE